MTESRKNASHKPVPTEDGDVSLTTSPGSRRADADQNVVPPIGRNQSVITSSHGQTRPAPPRRQPSALASWLRIAVVSEPTPAREPNFSDEATEDGSSIATMPVGVTDEPPPRDALQRVSSFLHNSTWTRFDPIFGKFTRSASWFGLAVLSGMERVGEAVVSVLGLDESRYQDVLDNMTEEEMDQARRVQEEREAEYERVRSIREMRQREANGLIPMEEGSSISTTSGNNEPTQSAVADVNSVFVSLTEN